MYDNKVVLEDFSLEPTNPIMLNFLSIQNFIDLIKSNTYFKGKGHCIDPILVNTKYPFQNTSFYETGPNDHHHLSFSVMKTTFTSEELEKLLYRDCSKFSPESFKNDLMLDSGDSKNDYLEFEKHFVSAINKNAFKKSKIFRRNRKLYVNKTLRKAIMKRLQLKNKANKTRDHKDFINY